MALSGSVDLVQLHRVVRDESGERKIFFHKLNYCMYHTCVHARTHAHTLHSHTTEELERANSGSNIPTSLRLLRRTVQSQSLLHSTPAAEKVGRRAGLVSTKGPLALQLHAL